MCSPHSGLVRACCGAALGFKTVIKLGFYGFTDLRGNLADRGAAGHATANQITAGMSCVDRADEMASQAETPGLEFRYGVKNIPHFEKVEKGGEDAWVA